MTTPNTVRVPRNGGVYLLKATDGNLYKIGVSRTPRQRKRVVSHTRRASIVHVIPTNRPFVLESFLHRRYAYARHEGEWFALRAEEVNEIRLLENDSVLDRVVSPPLQTPPLLATEPIDTTRLMALLAPTMDRSPGQPPRHHLWVERLPGESSRAWHERSSQEALAAFRKEVLGIV